MGAESIGLVTGRDQMMKRYVDAGKPFYLSTLKYWSTATFSMRVVNAGNGVAFAVLSRNQRVSAFDYAINSPKADGFGGTTILASYTDTNLTKPRQTNGSDEMVIEGLSLSVRDVRARFAEADIPANLDPEVLAAFRGLRPFMDVGALFRPPQLDSPFRLEDALGRLIRPRVSCTFVWDGQNNEKVGLASHCPDLPAASYLTAAGEPTEKNIYNLPEGWIWNKPGSERDTELHLDLVSEQTAIFTINGVQFPGAANGVYTYPQELAVDLHVQLNGFALGYDSAN
ncbi:MAG: hypothetical protein E6Q97_03200 [Desulfurellales bacterium]|nr:MAG: hypothetical protein E6Q97_03200 [Desulfurellales bacterium]